MLVANLKISGWLCAPIGALLGIAIGYLDYHVSEVQVSVLLLLLLCASLGFLHPAGAWRWALVTGFGIPLIHFAGLWLGLKPPYPVEPNFFATFLALIPCFIGAYSGVALRHLANNF